MRDPRLLEPDVFPVPDAVRLPPLLGPPEADRLLEPPLFDVEVLFCVEAMGKILLFYGAAGARMGTRK